MALANPLEAFVWGAGGSRKTPEQIAREREIADALIAQGIDTSPVGHWTQGLARMANVASGKIREGRADRAARDNATASQQRIAAMLGGLGGTSGASAPSSGMMAPAASTSAAPMDPASARVAQAHGDFDVRSGLIERGMPEHIADAFVMNFQDESGLNPGINEANPIVPGSRGGFGLSQWTGPRRRALEAFAAERGVDVADPNMQLDFLMTELQGPESSAWQAIQAAPDTGSAAAAIVNQFLRPAEQHRAAREARYLRAGGRPSGQASSLTGAMVNPELPMMGGGGATPAAQAMQQPAPVQAAQSGGISPAILEALSSPYASDAERSIANVLLQQHMSQQQAEQERMRAQQEAQIEMERRQQMATELGLDPRYANDEMVYEQAVQREFRDQPTDIREYEYARGQGYPGTFAEFQAEQRRAGATNIDNRNMGTIPQGYRMVYDATGNPIQMEPIPGGPADTSATDAAAMESRETSTSIITNAASRAREALRAGGLPATGTVGRMLSNLPETNAAELRRQVEVLKSNAKVENLQAMRAASPTGGALGAVSDKENAMLAAKSGALDPDSPTFERDLDDYERTLLRIVHGPKVGDAIFEQTRETAANKPVSEMTDEELEALANGNR